MVTVRVLLHDGFFDVGEFTNLEEATGSCLAGFIKHPTYFKTSNSISTATFLPMLKMTNVYDDFENLLFKLQAGEGKLMSAEQINATLVEYLLKVFVNGAHPRLIIAWGKAISEGLKLNEIKLEIKGKFDEDEIIESIYSFNARLPV